MPALILILPLIAAYVDQRPKAPQHHQAPPAVMRSFDLPPQTEMIYFVTID